MSVEEFYFNGRHCKIWRFSPRALEPQSTYMLYSMIDPEFSFVDVPITVVEDTGFIDMKRCPLKSYIKDEREAD